MPSGDLTDFPTRAAMRSLIEAGRFAEANQTLSFLHSAYERGGISDRELNRAFLAFDCYVPSMAGTLEDWVENIPGSYVGRLARAKHLVAKAGFHRGYDLSRNVKQEDWDVVQACYRRAYEDLVRSLELSSKPVLSYTTMMHMSIISGGDFDDQYRQAIALDPNSFEARGKMMRRLRPEWGGSLEAFKEYVESEEHIGLPEEERLKMEAEYQLARGHWFEHFEKNLEQAESAYLRSLTVKEFASNLAKYGGFLDHQRKRTDDAIVYLKRALSLDPDNDSAKCNLAMALTANDVRNMDQSLGLLREAADWGEWNASRVLREFTKPRGRFFLGLGSLMSTLGKPSGTGGWIIRLLARGLLLLALFGLIQWISRWF